MKETIVTGDVVKWVDEHGEAHNALVIHVWGQSEYEGNPPPINLVYVSQAPALASDQFGNRGFILETLVPHEVNQLPSGQFWFKPDANDFIKTRIDYTRMAQEGQAVTNLKDMA